MRTSDSRVQLEQELLEALESGGDWPTALRRLQASLPEPTWVPGEDFALDVSLKKSSLRGICELLELQRIQPEEAAALLRGLRQAEVPSLRLEEEEQRYEAGRLLGLGGMGEVREVEDRRLGRTVAHKRLLASQPEPELLLRFVQEARITAQLEHPNIVPVYDLRIEDGQPVLEMRVVRGRSLRQVLEAEELPELGRRLEVFQKLCDALAYAHSRGVLHRDLKPDNVMVGAFGEVQVMDWGLALRLDEERQAGQIAGTPAFMAPEQAMGRQDQLGPATDIYALGAVLYELVCGTRAFKGPTEEVLEQVRVGAFRRPREVRPQLARELEAIVLRAMALRPEARFSEVAELRAEIDRFQAGEAIQSLRYSSLDRGRLWLGRHRQRVVPVALTAGLALSLGLVGLVRYAADVAEARDEAMLEATRAQQAEDLALRRVVEAELASARAALAQEAWVEARERWRAASELGERLDMDTREAELGLSWAGQRSPPAWLELGEAQMFQGFEGGLLVWQGAEVVEIELPSGRELRRGPEEGVEGVWGELPASARVFPGGVELRQSGEVFRLELPAAPTELEFQRGRLLARIGAELHVFERSGAHHRLELPVDAPVLMSEQGLVVRGELDRDTVLDLSGRRVAKAERIPELVGEDWLVAVEGSLERKGPSGLSWKVASGPVERAVVSPDGTRVALLAFDPEVRVLDLETGEQVASVPVAQAGLVAWAGSSLLAVTEGSELQVHALPERAPGRLQLPEQAVGMGLSPDGERLLVAGWDGSGWLVELETGELVQTLEGPQEGVRDAWFSEDGQRAILAGRDGAAWVFELPSGELLERVELDSLLTSALEVEGELLAVGATGSFMGRSGQLAEGHPGVIWELERDPASGRLLTTGRMAEDATMRLWSASFEELARVELSHSAYRGALRGERMACGNHLGEVVVTDLEGRGLLELRAHHGPAMAVDMSEDLLATTGYDRELHVYDLDSGAPLLELAAFTQPGVDLVLTPDGRWLLALSGAGELLLLDLHREASLRALQGQRDPASLAQGLRLRGLSELAAELD